MNNLDLEVMYLPCVGPKRAEILHDDINVKTAEDLLFYFPYRYVDRSRIQKISEISGNENYVQLKGHFYSFATDGQGKKKFLRGIFSDETGEIDIIWFQGIKWVKEKISYDKTYVIFGKPTEFRGRYSISHPEAIEISEFASKIVNPYMPEYNTSERMKSSFLNSRGIAKLIKVIFDKNVKLDDILAENLRQSLRLIDVNEAIRNIHFPKTPDLLRAARLRFKFEELFLNQTVMIKQKVLREKGVRGYVFEHVGEKFMTFYENFLPFELTDAQKRVIKEIRADFKSSRQGNRLLQGDVGSGKTIVALLSMLIAIDNGFQTCIMAPTEVLAQQHFESFKSLLKDMPLKVELLTGSTRAKHRKIIEEQLQSGDLDILIGTHALIENNVQFKKLGLAIIDEQHKFGVAQRAKLHEKSEIPPHIIVMTATPIPRTLSMTLYGDLDVSVIDELPAGRKPIKTIHMLESRRGKLYEFMQNEIENGRQVYVVYPLIQESEAFDYKNLEEGYTHICERFPEPKYRIAMVHGKMKSDDKKFQMERFISGEAQIMVATTVIEVGVNVPNATVMVIESAERFGLSQLHQLRGRVGRGGEQSYCILMTDFKLSEDSRKRIETMVRTNDGFEIAEVDMRLRGPGNIFGTQQSGQPINFKIANLLTDSKILHVARMKAQEVLDNDPYLAKPENQFLAKAVEKEIMRSWSSVS